MNDGAQIKFRYTSDTVFYTFPWPQFEMSREAREGSEGKAKPSSPSRPSRDTVSKIDAVAHAALDATVLAAYGFSAKKDLLAQLLALNLEVAAKIEQGSPVTAPGVPPNYHDPKKLVTEDCIWPAGHAVV